MTPLERIRRATGETQLVSTSDMAGLADDSLDLIFCIQQIEEEFSVRIPDEDVVRFVTVGDIEQWLVAHA